MTEHEDRDAAALIERLGDLGMGRGFHAGVREAVLSEWATAILAWMRSEGYVKPEPAGDDEREALIEQATWALIDYDTDVTDRGVRDEHYRERRADVERVLPILFRRPEVPEPQGEHFHIWSDLPCKAGECRLEPQGESNVIPQTGQPTASGQASSATRTWPSLAPTSASPS